MWPDDQLVDLLNQQRLTERDKDCIRQLIAPEITLNFRRLCDFFSALTSHRNIALALATRHGTNPKMFVRDLDQLVGSAPTWERSRWDSAPILIARSLTSDELLRIGLWYTELDDVRERYQRILQQGTALRLRQEQLEVMARNSSGIIALHWALDSLLTSMADLIDSRRPFIHPAVERALDAAPPTNPSLASLPVVDPRQAPFRRRYRTELQVTSAHDLLRNDPPKLPFEWDAEPDTQIQAH